MWSGGLQINTAAKLSGIIKRIFTLCCDDELRGERNRDSLVRTAFPIPIGPHRDSGLRD
jgi:hypothetical protein